MPRCILTITCGALVLWAFPAAAYFGPGPAVSMIGSFFVLIGGIVLALLMVLIYPIRLLVKRLRKRKPGEKTPE